jgi:hypothetical protein
MHHVMKKVANYYEPFKDVCLYMGKLKGSLLSQACGSFN